MYTKMWKLGTPNKVKIQSDLIGDYELTQMFDVDKIYLATMSYHNGILDKFENDDLNNWKSIDRKNLVSDVLKDKNVTIDNQGAVSNRLLQNYIDVITDRQNYDTARSSIDVATKMITNLLPMIRKKEVGYFRACRQITPTFQADKKLEFCTGKSGVGAMALAVTNSALTQYTGLSLEYGAVDQQHFDFGELYEIYSKGVGTRMRISDWLSAMVNAHVDVAKDPYIFDINVNKFTYNHTTFLIRAGKGLSTFTFLAQPILKRYAAMMNNSGGIYGKNIDGRQRSKSLTFYKRDKKLMLMSEVLSSITEVWDNAKESMTKEQLVEETANLTYFVNKVKQLSGKQKTNDDLQLSWNYDVFDKDFALKCIQMLNGNITGTSLDAYQALMFQLYALEAFDIINDYSTKLEKLVQVSRIDTKKFGKTIQEQIDFVNKYELFKNTETGWHIKGMSKPTKQITVENNGKTKKTTVVDESFPLTYYFKQTLLDSKLRRATFYLKDLLKHQTFTATDQYKNLYIAINQLVRGDQSYVDYNGHMHHAYNPIGKADTSKQIGTALDSILCYSTFVANGPKVIKRYKNDANNNAEGPIDFVMNGDINNIIAKIKYLQFGKGHPKGLTLFERFDNFIEYVKTNPDSDIANGLINPATGEVTNDLLEYLIPQTKDGKSEVGRFNLIISQIQTKQHQKARLRSAFYQLLTHNDETVRQLARDIAFYAYYASYNQNTNNSFFDLVPEQFRVQYDNALADALTMKNKDRNKLITGVAQTKNVTFFDTITSEDLGTAREYLDVIARNYWYNNDIVPIQKFYSFRSDFNKAGTIKFESYVDPIAKKSFPGAIVTSNADGPYFKLVQNGVTYLYRKYGNITKQVPGKTKEWVNSI